MNSSSCIEQKGVIEEIDDGLAKVRVSTLAACGHCHAKSVCGITDGTARYYEVAVTETGFERGDSVIITMERTLGLRAAFIAYVVPFLLVIASLIILTTLHIKEIFSGTISIFILVPYFIGLYFLRDHLQRSFKFTLRKVI